MWLRLRILNPLVFNVAHLWIDRFEIESYAVCIITCRYFLDDFPIPCYDYSALSLSLSISLFIPVIVATCSWSDFTVNMWTYSSGLELSFQSRGCPLALSFVSLFGQFMYQTMCVKLIVIHQNDKYTTNKGQMTEFFLVFLPRSHLSHTHTHILLFQLLSLNPIQTRISIYVFSLHLNHVINRKWYFPSE